MPYIRDFAVVTFWIVSWIWLNPSSWNWLWNSNRCCLFYTANTILAGVPATLGAWASGGMILTPKDTISNLQLTHTLGCGCGFKCVNLKHNLGIDILSVQLNITLEWIPEDLVDVKSTLVQVMAWCCQATSHYLNQCWPRSSNPYGITRPQWGDGNVGLIMKSLFRKWKINLCHG